MKFFKNRAVATIIALLVIFASTFYSATSGIESLYAEKIEAAYDLQLSEKIQNCVAAANGTASVLSAYDEYSNLSSALRAARTAYFDAEAAADKYAAYNALRIIHEDIRDTYSADDFSGKDLQNLREYLRTFEARSLELEREFSEYKKSVDEYSNAVSAFPAVFFQRFANVPDALAF